MHGPRSLRTWVQTQLCLFTSVQLLANDLTSLGLGFLVSKMRMTIILPASKNVLRVK